jgi:hypothetical protein
LELWLVLGVWMQLELMLAGWWLVGPLVLLA